MIKLTRFDGTAFYVNADFIEFIETTPDTVISLIDHKKILVKETAQEVFDRIVEYHSAIAPHIPAAVTAMARWGAMHFASEGNSNENESAFVEGGNE